MNNNKNTEVISRPTAAQMQVVYEDACRKIDEGYQILQEAQDQLQGMFGTHNGYASFAVVDRNVSLSRPADNPKEIKKKIKRGVWAAILDLTGIRKMLSEARAKELETRLEKGDLPEITTEDIFATLEAFVQNGKEIQEEVVKEAFEALTPKNPWKPLKTNDAYQVGKKVILTGLAYPVSGGFHINYWRSQPLMVIERAFHLLDGKPLPETHRSALEAAIEMAPEGTGETVYFKFKCHGNGNVHIEFKRPDLVKELNQIAGRGKMNLKRGK